MFCSGVGWQWVASLSTIRHSRLDRLSFGAPRGHCGVVAGSTIIRNAIQKQSTGFHQLATMSGGLATVPRVAPGGGGPLRVSPHRERETNSLRAAFRYCYYCLLAGEKMKNYPQHARGPGEKCGRAPYRPAGGCRAGREGGGEPGSVSRPATRPSPVSGCGWQVGEFLTGVVCHSPPRNHPRAGTAASSVPRATRPAVFRNLKLSKFKIFEI